MKRLVCVGDIMQDVSAVISGAIYWGSDTVATVRTQGGGAAANVASWAAKNGFPTLVVGRVGNDVFGEGLIKELEGYGVETHVTRDPAHQSGMVVLVVDDKGERNMFPDPGANAFLELRDIPELSPDDLLFISGYAFIYPGTALTAQELIKRAKSQGITTAVDAASAGYLAAEHNKTLADNMLRNTDILLANEDEARILTGLTDPDEACMALAKIVPTVVVKMGARGAVGCQGGVHYRESSIDVPLVVDTTGAGDAFAGGFLPAWAEGRGMQEALHAGVMTAATCVGRIGGRP